MIRWLQQWRVRGAEKAHEDPAERLGWPEMEFPHVQAVTMRFAKV